jgi:hypothetical protein
MNGLAYDAKFFITYIVGEESELLPHKEKVTRRVDYSERALSLVSEIRPRLRGGYKDLTDDDLLVSGIFLVARKPGGAGVAGEPLSSLEANAL